MFPASSKFLHIPCQESSGTDLPYKTHDGDDVLTYANSWSNLRANPDGTDTIIVTDGRFDDIFDLRNLNGGLLMMFSMTYPAANPPAAQEKIFQYGAPNRTTPGGIYLEVNATNVQAVVAPDNSAGATAANALKPHATASDAVMTVGVYVDIANGFIMMGINGTFSNHQADIDLGQISAENSLPGLSTGLFALSFFTRLNASGVSDGQVLNSGTGNLSISDMWFVRFESDMLTSVSNMFMEYHFSPRGGLYSLDGV